MNVFSCAGRVIKAFEPFQVNDNGTTAVRFTVVAENGQMSKEGKKMVDFIPCLVFNPEDEMIELLSREKLGFIVELKGKVSTTQFMVNGKKQYRGEVIVFKNSFHVLID